MCICMYVFPVPVPILYPQPCMYVYLCTFIYIWKMTWFTVYIFVNQCACVCIEPQITDILCHEHAYTREHAHTHAHAHTHTLMCLCVVCVVGCACVRILCFKCQSRLHQTRAHKKKGYVCVHALVRTSLEASYTPPSSGYSHTWSKIIQMHA